MQIGFIRFLNEIRSRNYDLEFTLFHASNLIAQEGIINYNIDLEDNVVVSILSFFIRLDVEPVDQIVFRRIIDDLIEVYSDKNAPEEIQILFILYKEKITELYQKYLEKKISIESLKSALRRFCNQKDDFNRLIDFISASSESKN